MKALVTGVAGFIGSHLAEALVGRGDDVVGLDCFTDYYDVAVKRSNLAWLECQPRFRLETCDLRSDDIANVVADVEVIFHLAAQPGVRHSWRDGFRSYSEHNVVALQRLLEAARGASRLQRLVFASSSSVYGDAAEYPCGEHTPLLPRSPYGITKLAGEHLCRVYCESWDVPVTMLRYFTVFGPRQRPDMALHRLCEAALSGTAFPLFGDGLQLRDFTYVGDVVAANLAAADADIEPGAALNIAGGDSATMLDVIGLVNELTGRTVSIEHCAEQAGDVRRTGADIEPARRLLGWEPAVDVAAGLGRQVAWHHSLRELGPLAAAP